MTGRFDYAAASEAEAEARRGRGVRAIRVVEARTYRQRAAGLAMGELGRLPDDVSVLFDRCTCIHTFGMAGPISIAWLGPEEHDAEGRPMRRVIAVDSSVPPNRVLFGPRGTCAAMESHPLPGSAEACDGDTIRF